MAEEAGDETSKQRYTLEKVTDLLEFNTVVDTVERFVQPAHGKKLTVSTIEKAVNPTLERRFGRRQGDMISFSPDTTKMKFHGTSSRALHKILQSGFKLPENPGMYGRGVYFATDSSKAAQYSTEVTKLLLCEVALGRAMVVESADHSLTYESVRDAGYDSVYAPRNTKKTAGVLFDEFVVYHKDQAIPRYVVSYTEESISTDSDEEPYHDEPADAEYLPEGAVRWRKSSKSSRWSERYAYILHGRFVALFKNEKQCKTAVADLHSHRESKYEPEVSIDVTQIDTVDVKEEDGAQILIITLHDGDQQMFVVDRAYDWMKTILSLRSQLRIYETSVQDAAEKDSDDESDMPLASSSTSSPAMSAFEARKAARKQQVGVKIDAKASVARAVKEKVAVFDEVSGQFLGLLANDDAIKTLPSDKTKIAVHKGMLAIKTDKSWKIVYCTMGGGFFTAYRSSTSDSGRQSFSEYKKLELNFAKVVRSSHSFGKRIVPAFMIVVDSKASLFCGMGITEWIDSLQRFAGEGLKAQANQPLISSSERKRWNDSPGPSSSATSTPKTSKKSSKQRTANDSDEDLL